MAVLLNMIELRLGLVDETPGGAHGGGQGSTLGDKGGEFRGGHRLLGKELGLKHLAVLRRGVLEQKQDRQGELPAGDVGPERLADHLLVTDQIDAVVEHLVGDANLVAIVFESTDDRRRSPAEEGTQLTGDRKEGSGLHLEHPVVFGKGEIQVEATLGLEDLPRADIGGRIGNPTGDIGVGKLRRKPEGMSKQDIPNQNGEGVSPLCIEGGTVTAAIRSVHDVVVDKAGDVDELHDDREVDMVGNDPARGTG